MSNKDIRFAYTFDDLILVPADSSVLPNQVKVNTKLTRNIRLNIPIVSAAMDTAVNASISTPV